MASHTTSAPSSAVAVRQLRGPGRVSGNAGSNWVPRLERSTTRPETKARNPSFSRL
ncbi:MAG: hypothetical protein JF597_49485 [Streptomyces sp.]|uniref:hypothetical protein n=1 Tax=unclassified Streptomyces TaxID=2593676 RepID=UPI0025E18060|nr:hypothetical protein [Streptomyces sp.]MBW8801303.1 hypothetical protein [Streptomyces sp.]